MTDTRWHVWQETVTDPDQCIQFACPEEGDRPDGMPWDDSAPFTVRGSRVVLDWAGSVDGQELGPFGLDYDTQTGIENLAPAGIPRQTTVAAHFDSYQTPAPEPSQGETDGLEASVVGTDLPSESAPV